MKNKVFSKAIVGSWKKLFHCLPPTLYEKWLKNKLWPVFTNASKCVSKSQAVLVDTMERFHCIKMLQDDGNLHTTSQYSCFWWRSQKMFVSVGKHLLRKARSKHVKWGSVKGPVKTRQLRKGRATTPLYRSGVTGVCHREGSVLTLSKLCLQTCWPHGGCLRCVWKGKWRQFWGSGHNLYLWDVGYEVKLNYQKLLYQHNQSC